MLDTDPAPQGFESRCTYCGKPLTGQTAVYEVLECDSEATIALRFCSEAHAKAYASEMETEPEEADIIGRAGPT